MTCRFCEFYKDELCFFESARNPLPRKPDFTCQNLKIHFPDE